MKISKQKFKQGTLGVFTIILIISILILINIISDRFNTSVDVSENKLHTLSEQSINTITNIKTPVSIYILTNETNKITLIDQYKKFNKNINIEYKDLNYNPNFVKNYEEAGKPISPNSIIVSSDKRFKVIKPEELSDNNGKDLLEFKLTNALIYVTKEKVNEVIYSIVGHNETIISDNTKEMFKQIGYNFKDVNLSVTEEIPPDISLLLITLPSIDYSEHEIKNLKNFIANGVNILFLIDNNINNFPNIKSILDDYAVSIENSYIYEGNKQLQIEEDGLAFFSTLQDGNMLSDLYNAGATGPLVYMSSPINITVDNSNIFKILTSSDMSYTKNSTVSSTFEKEEGDKAGPFTIAVHVNAKHNQVIIMSTPVLLIEEFDQFSQNLNIQYLSKFFIQLGSPEIDFNIPIKSMNPSTTLLLTENQKKDVFIINIVAIPSCIILAGLFVIIRRKNK